MDTIKPVAWRCIWRKSGWEQYHDETDPLPEKWDCKPNEVIALYDQETVDALRKDAERYRWLRQHYASANFEPHDHAGMDLIFAVPQGAVSGNCDKTIDGLMQGATATAAMQS